MKLIVEAVDDLDLNDIIKNDISEYTDSKLVDLLKEQHLGDSMFSTPADKSDKQVAVVKDKPIATNENYSPVSNLDSDFELVRKNLIQLTTMGGLMLDDLLSLARASEHPNAFKTVTETLTALSQMNKDLLDAYDKKISIETKLKKAEAEAAKTEPPTNQTNQQTNIYMGNCTTDELFQNLKKEGLIGKKDET